MLLDEILTILSFFFKLCFKVIYPKGINKSKVHYLYQIDRFMINRHISSWKWLKSIPHTHGMKLNESRFRAYKTTVLQLLPRFIASQLASIHKFDDSISSDLVWAETTVIQLADDENVKMWILYKTTFRQLATCKQLWIKGGQNRVFHIGKSNNSDLKSYTDSNSPRNTIERSCTLLENYIQTQYWSHKTWKAQIS